MEIRLLGVEMFHAYGRTDTHDGADSRFFEILSNRQKKKTIYLPITSTYQHEWQLQNQIFIAWDI